MEINLHRYVAETGWQPPLDSRLDGKRTLVLFFSDLPGESAGEPLRLLQEGFPASCLMGCSTAGQVHQARYLEHSATAAVIRFDGCRLQLAHADLGEHGDCEAAGRKLAAALDAPDLAAVLILSEGLRVNGSALMEGVNQVLEGRVPVTGGLAADGARFEQTWVVCGNERLPQRVCGLGIYGSRLRVAHGSRGGWDVLGPERLVTRSEGNRLFELDGQPALALYKRYLGERADDLPASGLLFPLALRREEDDAEPKVRTILAVDEETQSITFAGDIPEGGWVQLMYANFDRLVAGAGEALEAFDWSGQGDGALFALAVSCVGRRLILGQRVEEEIEALLERLPPHAQLSGFYAYGELSPLASGRCDLHNQTMTVTLWWEA